VGIDCEAQALVAARREFLEWWTPALREDLERRFERYIGPEPEPAPVAEPPSN
jgi:hypothetical protein